MSNFDDYNYKDNTKVINLHLRQKREKKLYPWEISSFLGKFNTYYYKSELINTIGIALNKGMLPEDIIVFDQSFNVRNQNSQLSYLSLVDSDIKHLYFIGLPYSILPNKKVFLLNRLFFYFRKINVFLYSHKINRINRNELGNLYRTFITLNFNTMISTLKEYVNAVQKDKYLEKSQIKVLNTIYEDFEKEYKEFESDEDKINIYKSKILNNTIEKDDLKTDIYDKYFKDFYYYLNNIQRPFVVVRNGSSNVLSVLCRGQFNKEDVKSSTLDLISLSHNSPIKLKIKGGVELFRTFITGNRTEEIEQKQQSIDFLTNTKNELDRQEDSKDCEELENKIAKNKKEKETLEKIREAETLGNINNVDNILIETIKSKLKQEEESNQRKSNILLSDYNLEADLEETDVDDFDIDMAV